MPNSREPGGCLSFINQLGRLALKFLMGSWEEALDKKARKYTLFAGSLLFGGILGVLTSMMIRYFPIYPIDFLKPQSRESKLFVCFVVIPATFIILCFALEGIRQKVTAD
jgi:hypothetical protein